MGEKRGKKKEKRKKERKKKRLNTTALEDTVIFEHCCEKENPTYMG
jgi:hypothetical protein